MATARDFRSDDELREAWRAAILADDVEELKHIACRRNLDRLLTCVEKPPTCTCGVLAASRGSLKTLRFLRSRKSKHSKKAIARDGVFREEAWKELVFSSAALPDGGYEVFRKWCRAAGEYGPSARRGFWADRVDAQWKMRRWAAEAGSREILSLFGSDWSCVSGTLPLFVEPEEKEREPTRWDFMLSVCDGTWSERRAFAGAGRTIVSLAAEVLEPLLGRRWWEGEGGAVTESGVVQFGTASAFSSSLTVELALLDPELRASVVAYARSPSAGFTWPVCGRRHGELGSCGDVLFGFLVLKFAPDEAIQLACAEPEVPLTQKCFAAAARALQVRAGGLEGSDAVREARADMAAVVRFLLKRFERIGPEALAHVVQFADVELTRDAICKAFPPVADFSWLGAHAPDGDTRGLHRCAHVTSKCPLIECFKLEHVSAKEMLALLDVITGAGDPESRVLLHMHESLLVEAMKLDERLPGTFEPVVDRLVALSNRSRVRIEGSTRHGNMLFSTNAALVDSLRERGFAVSEPYGRHASWTPH